jgi:glutamine synthetase
MRKGLEPGEVKRRLVERGIRFIRYLYVDLDNVIRGRVSRVESFEADAEGGLTLARVMQSGFTVFDQLVPTSSFGPAGEVRLMPDLGTLRPLPYAEATAAVLCEQYVDDAPFELDPRPRLRRLLEEAGFDVLIGIEPEFYLFREDAAELSPFDPHLCFSTSGMNAAQGLVAELVDALRAQGIEAEHYYPEYGKGQHELSLAPASPLAAADNFVFFRETLRALASRRGLLASFMPKPSDALPGSGLHVHVSLFRGGRNAFRSTEDKYGLSELAYHFMGGLLKHLEALLAFTAASVNSYKRLRPNSWASAFTCWGPENREAAIRVPRPSAGREEMTTRLELKFVDGTANPYLALASILAAGLEGIRNRIDPSEPCLDNPAAHDESEREAKGWRRYPENFADALDHLERSSFFRSLWGERMVDEYIKLKRFQWEAYHLRVTEWERSAFLAAY